MKLLVAAIKTSKYFEEIMFDRQAINVRLGATGKSILMVTRTDCNSEKCFVVFADAGKLSPFVDRENSQHDPAYLSGKALHAHNGIIEAMTTSFEPYLVPSGDDNPLPMAMVHCFKMGHELMVGFADGLTRTTELICQQAAFIPLQTPHDEAAFLHSLVGIKDRPPIPAIKFDISGAERQRFLLDYSRRMRNRGAQPS